MSKYPMGARTHQQSDSVTLNQANLKHNHIYLTKLVNKGFFPKEMMGGPNKATVGKEALIKTDTGAQFRSDIDRSKKIFRNRGSVGNYLRNGFSAGDKVYVSKISDYEYLLSKNIRPEVAPTNGLGSYAQENVWWDAASKLVGKTLYTRGHKRAPFQVIGASDTSLKILYGTKSAPPRAFSKELILGACILRSKGLEVNATNLIRAGVARKKTNYSYLPVVIDAIFENIRDAAKGGAKTSWGRGTDPDRKADVEKAAIQETTKRFRKAGYQVTTREKDNLGWDLEASMGSEVLLLEVKGLFGSEVNFGLTPNEYRKQSEYRNDGYRICVVTKALDRPILSVFFFSTEKDVWIDEKGSRLKFKVLESAIVTQG